MRSLYLVVSMGSLGPPTPQVSLLWGGPPSNLWYINIESDLKGMASNLFSYTHVVRVGVTEQFWVRVW